LLRSNACLRGQHQELSAVSLLENVPALEKELLVQLAGADNAARLKPIVWDEVGAQVYAPQWVRLVQLNADRLKGVMPESLSSVAADLKAFGRTLVDVSNEPPDSDSAEVLANAVVGAAMALLLIQRGGEMCIAPGQEVTVNFGAYNLKPFGLLAALKCDATAAGTWVAQCAEVGIAGIDLATVAPPAVRNQNHELTI